MPSKPVIEVDRLRKTYGSLVAVNDISFTAYQGEIFGIVGPNGAGKTTTVECIEGVRRSDGGTLSVLGLDPKRDPYALRSRIGVQFQQAQLQPRIRVWEALDLYASFYVRSVDWRALVDELGLGEKRDTTFYKLSGGQKQRLFIALALINDPELVFLDELTTGLDPHARRAMWELVRGVRDRGKTVVLTTHFMEEAERLCDRVAIVDGGRIVALDTPANLIRNLGAEQRLVFAAQGPFDESLLGRVDGVTRVEQAADSVVVHGRGENLVAGVVVALSASGVRFRNLRTEQPSLEDVFLALTGHALRD